MPRDAPAAAGSSNTGNPDRRAAGKLVIVGEVAWIQLPGARGKLQAEVIGRDLGGRKHAPKANEEAPGGHPGACRIFPLMRDQYLAVTGPAPALNRKLRPTLTTFLVSLTSNGSEVGPPTKQATGPHTTLSERLPKS